MSIGQKRFKRLVPPNYQQPRITLENQIHSCVFLCTLNTNRKLYMASPIVLLDLTLDDFENLLPG